MQQNRITRVGVPALALVLTSACLGYARADPPAVLPLQPPECAKPKAQHFCCVETWSDKDGGQHGDDCETIGADGLKSCALLGGATLHCAGSWNMNSGADVSCK
jgi:hypothetical protein